MVLIKLNKKNFMKFVQCVISKLSVNLIITFVVPANTHFIKAVYLKIKIKCIIVITVLKNEKMNFIQLKFNIFNCFINKKYLEEFK
jgi:hypothetical protein